MFTSEVGSDTHGHISVTSYIYSALMSRFDPRPVQRSVNQLSSRRRSDQYRSPGRVPRHGERRKAYAQSCYLRSRPIGDQRGLDDSRLSFQIKIERRCKKEEKEKEEKSPTCFLSPKERVWSRWWQKYKRTRLSWAEEILVKEYVRFSKKL